jgi:hypothetical protein
MEDPIVDEVRKIRAGIFKKHDSNLAALVKHLQRRQKAKRRKTVRLGSKKVQAA